MKLLAIILALLLISPVASAYEVIFMSGFDSCDEDSTGYDSLEFTEHLSGGATDGDIAVQWTTIQKTSNGGDDSSHAAMYVNVASGEQAYYEPATTTVGMCDDPGGTCTDDGDCSSGSCRIADSSPFPLDGEYELTVGVRAHIGATAPGGKRMWLAIIEDGDQIGCNLQWTNSPARGLILRYGTTELSTLSYSALRYACATYNGVDYYHLPCDDDGDCPGDCTADGSPTQAEYWAPIELYEYSQNPNVTCQLRIADHLVADYLHTPSTVPAQVETFWIGAVGTESATLNFYADSVAACLGSRCGFGYVGTIYPSADGTTKQWSISGTGSGCGTNSHYECVNDYGDSGDSYQLSDSDLRRYASSKTEVIKDFTTSVGFSEAEDMTIDAVELLALGRDEGANDIRKVTVSLGVGDYWVQSPEVALVNTDGNYVRQLARVITDNPDPLEDTFLQSDIDTIQGRLVTGSDNNAFIHMEALVGYVHVILPGEPLPATIPDGNYGTNDGEITIAALGDSTTGGTLSVQCVGGDRAGMGCSQDTYCNWDAAEMDKPAGGCLLGGTACQTCSGLRAGINGGAGYRCDVSDPGTSEALCQSICDGGDKQGQPCDEESDCTGTGGDCIFNTCSCTTPDCGGTCDKNTAVPCDSHQDCEDLGVCETGGTCVESCPNGDCPEQTAWLAQVSAQVAADNIVTCAEGGKGSYTMDQKFDEVYEGAYTGMGCTAIKGDLAAPDVILSLIGVNDSATKNHDPNCTSIFAGSGFDYDLTMLGIPAACTPGSQVNCMDDTDCASVHADSKCAGRLPGSKRMCTGFTLTFAGEEAGRCGVERRWYCRTDSDCTGIGDGTCTTSDATALYPQGSCGCDSDSDCTGFGDYVCKSHICHRQCEGDKECDGGTRSGLSCTTNDEDPTTGCPGSVCSWRCYDTGGCNTGQKACYGTCTKPAADIDCSDDSDCRGTDFLIAQSIPTYDGVCSGGHCTCTGHQACRDSICQTQYERDFLGEGLRWHFKALDRFDRWQSVADAGSDEPIVVFMTVPDTAATSECQYGRGDKQYIQKSNQHLLTDAYCAGGSNADRNCFVDSDCPSSTCERRFKYVVDSAAAMRAVSKADCFTDQVHWTPTCGDAVGDAVAEYLNGFNSCALDAETPNQRPQRYCRNPGGDWTSTTCTLDTEDSVCTSGATCQIRVCTGATDASSDCPNVSDTCNTLS